MATDSRAAERDADRSVVFTDGDGGTESGSGYFAGASSVGGGDSGDGGNDARTAGTRKRRSDAGQPRGSRRAKTGPTETWAPEAKVDAADPNDIKRDLQDGLQFVGKQLAVVGGAHWEVSMPEARLLAGPSARIMEHIGQGQISFKASLWIVGLMGGAMLISRTVQTWLLVQQARRLQRTPVPEVYNRAFEQQGAPPQNPDGYSKVDPASTDLYQEQ